MRITLLSLIVVLCAGCHSTKTAEALRSEDRVSLAWLHGKIADHQVTSFYGKKECVCVLDVLIEITTPEELRGRKVSMRDGADGTRAPELWELHIGDTVALDFSNSAVYKEDGQFSVKAIGSLKTKKEANQITIAQPAARVR